MSDWTEGYVADIVYTYGYYSELNPQRARFALLNKGVVPPDFQTACELGFGQGLSTNIHAAAGTCAWWGTDFNPAQAGFASALASASKAAIRLYEDSFEEFASRTDLPDFDFIGLHGIWSWISDDNRRVIVDFIRRKLKVGGVVYASYNTLPGWSAMAPIRHLLTEHAERQSGAGEPMVTRIDAALEFTHKLIEANPGYLRANPQIKERFGLLKGQNRHYLAHEYFNRDWHPMYFADAARLLSAAKINFAASAYLLDHMDRLALAADQSNFMASITDPMLRESVRDFMVNQQFRRDYWVKGARPMTAPQRLRALRGTSVVLTAPVGNVPKDVRTQAGLATLSANVRDFLLEQLGDHQPRSIEALESAGAARGVTLSNILEIIPILVGSGHIDIAQDDESMARAVPQAARLNAHLIDRANLGGEGTTLAAARTGGGLGLGRFQQMFLGHAAKGVLEEQALAQEVWQTLTRQGQRLLRDGKPLESEQDNLAELQSQAKSFLSDVLPLCKSMGVMPA
jgi:SAM-dependent methyltransferase